MPDRGLLIYNTAAGTAAKHPPEQLLEALRIQGADVRLHEFAKGDEPGKIASNAVAAGVNWIAVAGGDGTVEATAAALLGTDVILGIVPCGTYNNFALNAGVPTDPLEACRAIAAGHTRAIDVGIVNGKPFFECVGIGLDAALFPLGEEIKSGAIVQILELFHRASRYPLQRFQIELDRPISDAVAIDPSQTTPRLLRAMQALRRPHLRVRAFMVTVSNGPYYGMNFRVAPGARIDDGQLTVTIFKRHSKFQLWWHYFSIRLGRKVSSPGLITLRAGRIRITHRHRLHAHADGNEITNWPIDISIRQAALRIFSPPSTRKM
jgi:diacylglycerol kinase (ATP)